MGCSATLSIFLAFSIDVCGNNSALGKVLLLTHSTDEETKAPGDTPELCL